MADKVITYRGRPLDELTREELISAIHWLNNELQRERTTGAKDREFLFDIMKSRKP